MNKLPKKQVSKDTVKYNNKKDPKSNKGIQRLPFDERLIPYYKIITLYSLSFSIRDKDHTELVGHKMQYRETHCKNTNQWWKALISISLGNRKSTMCACVGWCEYLGKWACTNLLCQSCSTLTFWIFLILLHRESTICARVGWCEHLGKWACTSFLCQSCRTLTLWIFLILLYRESKQYKLSIQTSI